MQLAKGLEFCAVALIAYNASDPAIITDSD
jgi:hypothetical protein